jgi:hypothetical protein
MMLDEKRHTVEVNSRTHLEMDEIEELLELARKTDERSWCILTLAFNHGLRVSEREETHSVVRRWLKFQPTTDECTGDKSPRQHDRLNSIVLHPTK